MLSELRTTASPFAGTDRFVCSVYVLRTDSATLLVIQGNSSTDLVLAAREAGRVSK